MTLSRALLVVLLTSCQHQSIPLGNLACTGDGQCLDGYTCDAVTNICITTGDACEESAAPSPCLFGDTDCANGCRTCVDGQWSDCQPGVECVDEDGDGVGDGTGDNASCAIATVDTNDGDANVCADTDADGCDDCSGGGFDPANDGADSDGDGSCDAGDPCTDVDGDGLGNGGAGNVGCANAATDTDDGNSNVCGDVDLDTCEDCSSGTWDRFNDGTDSDSDGVCDAAPTCPDGDSDGVGDGTGGNAGCVTLAVDANDDDASVCADTDADDCDDCSVASTWNPANDGPDDDGDTICDSGDVCAGHDDRVDTDSDGVPDGCDPCDGNETPGADCGTCRTCDGVGGCGDDLDEDQDCGTCQECAGGGTCVDAAPGTDPRDDCPAQDCEADGCDGDGACQRAADGSACAGTDTDYCTSSCNDQGVCQDATPPVCDDGLLCNGVETCVAGTGCASPARADDGTPCDEGAGNDADLCNSSCQVGVCIAASAPVCDDGLVCNGVETCVPATGCEGPASVAPDGTGCDEGAGADGDACNSSCQAGECAAASPPGTWHQDGWSHRRQLSFVAQTETLPEFPVLVVLSPSNFDYTLSEAPDGTDLRFVDPDGTELSYHIEEWDSSGSSTIWVKVPEISISSVADFIWMYYGNPGASDACDESGTWDDGFVGVWHLNETAGSFDDSKSNHDGAAQGGVTRGTTGQVSGAITLNGSDGYVVVPHDASLSLATYWTIEAWVHTTAFGGSWDALVSKDCSSDQETRPAGLWLEADQVQIWYTPGGENLASVQRLATNTWQYLVAVFDDGSLRLYIDGEPDNSTTTSTPDTADYDLYFGQRGENTTAHYWFGGSLDEVRISTTPRTEAWIRAQYLSMTDRFVTHHEDQPSWSCP